MNICTRQTAFLGPANQKKLQEATVAIIGVGALGSASAHLLTRMGIGKLILCDDDIVADHNLGRQHMYLQEDIGKKKASTLAHRLKEIRKDIQIEVHELRIDTNTISCCKEADLILDGTDNHVTRRVIDAYAKQQNKSWVHAAAIENKGTVVYFPPTLTYDAIYKGKETDHHCSISGVLMTTTTAVATLQTHMVIQHIIGEKISQIMYRLDGLNWSQIKL